MKEYLLLLRGGRPADTMTEEENKAGFEAWGAFMEGLGVNGSLVGGCPLVAGGMLVSAASTQPEPQNSGTDDIVGGYLIIKADSLEDAAEIALDCPHVDNDGVIEVREIAPMPSM